MVALPSWLHFWGLIVFPKWDNYIEILMAGVVQKASTTTESPTIILMIPVDMFRVMTKCLSGEMYS